MIEMHNYSNFLIKNIALYYLIKSRYKISYFKNKNTELSKKGITL